MNVGFLYAIGAAMTWGIVYQLDERILTDIPPDVLVLLDSIFSLLVVLPLIAIRYPAIKSALISKETNWPIVIGSIALATLANFLIFSSIRHLSASTASIFEISYPLFVGIFGYLFFRTPINTATVLGGALIFAGSVVIIRFS